MKNNSLKADKYARYADKQGWRGNAIKQRALRDQYDKESEDYRKSFINDYIGQDLNDRYNNKKHPMMDTGHRAKIFAPFDALRGFNLAIMSKEVPYVPKRILEEEEQEELNRRLTILHNLTFNGRIARANKPVAEVTYFVPCADRNHEA